MVLLWIAKVEGSSARGLQWLGWPRDLLPRAQVRVGLKEVNLWEVRVHQ